MEVLLDDASLAHLQGAEIDLTLHVRARLNVTPFTARQKVNGWLLERAGTGLMADAPALVAGNGRLVWRVPVWVSLPGRERLGQAGAINVDAQTAEIIADSTLVADLINRAEHLAAGSPL